MNTSVDLMMSPEIVPVFKKIMRSNYFKYQLYIKDVQQLVDSEHYPSENDSYFSSSATTNANSFNWKQYQTLRDINSWLEYLEKEFPSNVKLIYGGRSHEGRAIVGVRLSFAQGTQENPGVFIEGGIHAREWISPATVTYLLNEFLTSQNPRVRALARKHDWYMFPVCNPDGYVYTHTTVRIYLL